MQLTDTQEDALKELINIAFARTAASLSQLTGYQVVLELPRVAICPVAALAPYLQEFMGGEIASVHQLFTGPLSGNAMLLLSHEGARILTDLLTDQHAPSQQMDQSAREVFTEVGNILLNSCLGMFGNLLQVRIAFAVPRMHLDSLDDLLHSLVIAGQEMRYALLAWTRFHLQGSTVNGYVALVLGVTALEHLLEQVNCWAERAVQVPDTAGGRTGTQS